MNTIEIFNLVQNTVKTIIASAGEPVAPCDLGLDSRAGVGCKIYLADDAIIVFGCNKNIEYFGGFEYVDEEYKSEIGALTVYSAKADRINDLMNKYTFASA